MSKCINCGRYTNQNLCDYCLQEIQKVIEKSNFDKFHKKYDNQKIWKCENGIYVRSQAERTVADFLYKNNIPFEYEKECKYGEYNPTTKETIGRFLVPDFFIPGPVYFHNVLLENIYIELWGRKDKKYLETKEYKINVYRAHKSTLINIYLSDLYDYKKILSYKLTRFNKNTINFE